MPGFVISLHKTSSGHEHYDIMLEKEDVLKTWRTTSNNFSNPLLLEESFDHRKLYLTYEGPIKTKSGEGEVKIWDKGEYKIVTQTPKEMLLTLSGSKIQGDFIMRKIHEEKKWLLIPVTFGQTTKKFLEQTSD